MPTETPKSSTVEDQPAYEQPTNRTVNGLFAAACEAGWHVHAHEAQHVEKHTDIVFKALQCVMELVELGRDQPDELKELLDYHKARNDLDTIGRVVKLVFPKETPQLRNCYADALRHAERHGKSAEQIPSFLREKRIKKAARDEVKARRGEKPPATKAPIKMPLGYARFLFADGEASIPGKLETGPNGCVFVPSKPIDQQALRERLEPLRSWQSWAKAMPQARAVALGQRVVSSETTSTTGSDTPIPPNIG